LREAKASRDAAWSRESDKDFDEVSDAGELQIAT